MKPIIAVPATIAIVYRAWSRQSLTPAALVVATLTAIAHALHPWSVFFALLAVFFLAGTAVTKIKHHQKSQLTLSSAGGASPSSTPSPRTIPQVLANSLCASILITVHWIYMTPPSNSKQSCFPNPSWRFVVSTQKPFDVLPPLGILANYAAVTADTFSSELGILSPSAPFLLTDVPAALFAFRLPRRVPPGTNGGVTLVGLAAATAGATIIGIVGVGLMPFCETWMVAEKGFLIVLVSAFGVLGSVLDSLLGGCLQATVVDNGTGKVVENVGGGKVLFEVLDKSAARLRAGEKKGRSRTKVSGMDLLDNNGVNFVMAASMSIAAMVLGWWITDQEL